MQLMTARTGAAAATGVVIVLGLDLAAFEAIAASEECMGGPQG